MYMVCWLSYELPRRYHPFDWNINKVLKNKKRIYVHVHPFVFDTYYVMLPHIRDSYACFAASFWLLFHCNFSLLFIILLVIVFFNHNMEQSKYHVLRSTIKTFLKNTHVVVSLAGIMYHIIFFFKNGILFFLEGFCPASACICHYCYACWANLVTIPDLCFYNHMFHWTLLFMMLRYFLLSCISITLKWRRTFDLSFWAHIRKSNLAFVVPAHCLIDTIYSLTVSCRTS